MHAYLRLFSTTIASFHVISILSTIVFVGSFGSWISNIWLPLTRRIWSIILLNIPYLNIKLDNIEKDTLTALIFFVPMATMAVFLRTPPNEEEDSLKNHFYELFSLICGIILMVIVAGSAAVDVGSFWESIFTKNYFILTAIFFATALKICTGQSPEYTSNFVTYTLLFLVGLFMAEQVGILRGLGTALMLACLTTIVRYRPERVIGIILLIVSVVAVGTIYDFATNLQTELEKI